jgi:hypothetical protein
MKKILNSNPATFSTRGLGFQKSHCSGAIHRSTVISPVFSSDKNRNLSVSDLDDQSIDSLFLQARLAEGTILLNAVCSLIGYIQKNPFIAKTIWTTLLFSVPKVVCAAGVGRRLCDPPAPVKKDSSRDDGGFGNLKKEIIITKGAEMLTSTLIYYVQHRMRSRESKLSYAIFKAKMDYALQKTGKCVMIIIIVHRIVNSGLLEFTIKRILVVMTTIFNLGKEDTDIDRDKKEILLKPSKNDQEDL